MEKLSYIAKNINARVFFVRKKWKNGMHIEKKYILLKEIHSIYFCARRSTNPSAFLTETRGTPDCQPGDFCHHTVEDTSIKEEERKSLNLFIKYENY